MTRQVLYRDSFGMVGDVSAPGDPGFVWIQLRKKVQQVEVDDKVFY